MPGIRGLGLADIDAVGQPRLGDDGPCAGDRVRLELDADELERGEAPGHRHEPAAAAAMDIDDTAAARQVRDELRERGQHLLEEHRDVLTGQGRDRLAVALGSLGDRRPGPEEVGHAAPIHRRDDGVHELATEEVGPIAIEQDRRHVLVHHEAPVIEGRQVVRVGRPCPGVDGSRVGAGRRRQLGRRHARVAGGAHLLEEPELDAQVHQPRPVEAPEAGDQVVVPVVVAHARIVARCPRPGSR